MKLYDFIRFGGMVRDCKEWREYKTKWDGKIPRKNTKAYREYKADTEKVTAIIHHTRQEDLYKTRREMMDGIWSVVLEEEYQKARNDPNCDDYSDAELWDALVGDTE